MKTGDPNAMEQTHSIVNNSAPRCPYCHEAVTINSSKTACESCMAWHHKECWTEHGACSACGRGQAESLESQSTPAHHPSPETRSCRRPNCDEATQSQLRVVRYQKLCLSHAKEKAENSTEESKLLSIACAFFLFFLILGLSVADTQSDEAVPYILMSLFCALLLCLSSFRSSRRNLKKLKEGQDKEKKAKEEIEKGA